MSTKDHFIADEQYDDETLEDFRESARGLKKDSVKSNRITHTIYRLGQEIANSVRWFGQEKVDANGHRSAMCICPKCGNLWRVELVNVRNGNSKSCGCK